MLPRLSLGRIFIWSGSIATIPAGYSLCDGTKGTPDLRDRFIPGSTSLYPQGSTGGSLTHVHGFSGDGHDHSLGFGAGPILDFTSVIKDRGTTIAEIAGTTNTGSTTPPYHALPYVMEDL